jgi:hypothetical protein
MLNNIVKYISLFFDNFYSKINLGTYNIDNFPIP